MQNYSSKRIAKNTIFLYVRMVFVMAISLYTSRVILKALGVDDYGVANVVGGVVGMLSFLNSSMATSTQRFLNFEMGSGTLSRLKEIFSVSLSIHILIAVIAVIILETFGLWFVCNKIDIQNAGLDAVIWVYQCAVVTFAFSIIITPYYAAIIANEKMSMFALISVLDVILKLAVAFLISLSAHRLQTYAVLFMGIALITDFFYFGYSLTHFPECRCRFVKDLKLAKEMLTFSGWMIFGCLANIFSGQGVNILINLFFGPAFNAARAVAMQIQGGLGQLVSNFMTAVKPQIVKSYSGNDQQYMYKLVFSSSKLSFSLLFLIGLPILINADYIIHLWIVDVSPLAVLFSRLIIIEYMITALYEPIAYVNQASGKIKYYQMSISILFLLIFTITWIIYRNGAPVYSTFIVSIVTSMVGLFVRLLVLKKVNAFPVSAYLREAIFPIACVGIISFIIPIYIHQIIDNQLLNLILTSSSGIAIFIILVWFFCLNRKEKDFVKIKVISYFKKK